VTRFIDECFVTLLNWGIVAIRYLYALGPNKEGWIMAKKYVVRLTNSERETLNDLIK
jgi:hypothetical protein